MKIASLVSSSHTPWFPSSSQVVPPAEKVLMCGDKGTVTSADGLNSI